MKFLVNSCAAGTLKHQERSEKSGNNSSLLTVAIECWQEFCLQKLGFFAISLQGWIHRALEVEAENQLQIFAFKQEHREKQNGSWDTKLLTSFKLLCGVVRNGRGFELPSNTLNEHGMKEDGIYNTVWALQTLVCSSQKSQNDERNIAISHIVCCAKGKTVFTWRTEMTPKIGNSVSLCHSTQSHVNGMILFSLATPCRNKLRKRKWQFAW